MIRSDPTDHALATIASILDAPETRRESEKAVAAEQRPVVPPPLPVPPSPIEAHGYAKHGPGPMASIRFKWTVRRGDDGQFYVHETVGDNTAPVVTGPLGPDAAIKLVDERESEAQRRYERLKAEMAARVDTAELIRLGGGEA